MVTGTSPVWVALLGGGSTSLAGLEASDGYSQVTPEEPASVAFELSSPPHAVRASASTAKTAGSRAGRRRMGGIVRAVSERPLRCCAPVPRPPTEPARRPARPTVRPPG